MHLSNNPIKIVKQSPNNLQNYSQENSTNIQIKETSLNNEYESKHVKKRTNSFDVVEKDVIKSQAHTRLPRRDHQANDYGLINEPNIKVWKTFLRSGQLHQTLTV